MISLQHLCSHVADACEVESHVVPTFLVTSNINLSNCYCCHWKLSDKEHGSNCSPVVQEKMKKSKMNIDVKTFVFLCLFFFCWTVCSKLMPEKYFLAHFFPKSKSVSAQRNRSFEDFQRLKWACCQGSILPELGSLVFSSPTSTGRWGFTWVCVCKVCVRIDTFTTENFSR